MSGELIKKIVTLLLTLCWGLAYALPQTPPGIPNNIPQAQTFNFPEGFKLNQCNSRGCDHVMVIVNVGVVISADGFVRAVDDRGVARVLHAGGIIYSNETIVAGADGRVCFKLISTNENKCVGPSQKFKP